ALLGRGDRRLVGAVDGKGLELDRVAHVQSEVAGDRGSRRGRGELVRGPATRLQVLDRVGDIAVVVAIALADQDADRDGDRQEDEEEHGRRSGPRARRCASGGTAAPSARAREVLDCGSALVATSRAAADAVALLLVERRPALLATGVFTGALRPWGRFRSRRFEAAGLVRRLWLHVWHGDLTRRGFVGQRPGFA